MVSHHLRKMPAKGLYFFGFKLYDLLLTQGFLF